jgi:hypothetical protein
VLQSLSKYAVKATNAAVRVTPIAITEGTALNLKYTTQAVITHKTTAMTKYSQPRGQVLVVPPDLGVIDCDTEAGDRCGVSLVCAGVWGTDRVRRDVCMSSGEKINVRAVRRTFDVGDDTIVRLMVSIL